MILYITDLSDLDCSSENPGGSAGGFTIGGGTVCGATGSSDLARVTRLMLVIKAQSQARRNSRAPVLPTPATEGGAASPMTWSYAWIIISMNHMTTRTKPATAKSNCPVPAIHRPAMSEPKPGVAN